MDEQNALRFDRWRRRFFDFKMSLWRALSRRHQARYLKSRMIKLPFEVFGRATSGYAVCPLRLSAESVVYSCGIGKDVSFDMDLINRYGLDVFAFDPTPQSRQFVERFVSDKRFRFFSFGVSVKDGEELFRELKPKTPDYSPSSSLSVGSDVGKLLSVKTLSTIMKDLNHNKIDLLKLDIEGAEYDVLRDLLIKNIDVEQIVFEMHPILLNLSLRKWGFSRIGLMRSQELLHLLESKGYRAFYQSERGTEFSFIKVRG